MIRNIIFDFGGVLLDLDPQRCIDRFEAIGYTEIREKLSMAHQKGVLGNIELGLVTVSELCDEIRTSIAGAKGDTTVEELPSNAEIVKAFCSMADGIPQYRLDFVNELKQKGYQVDALSNTNAVHWGYCQRYFVECGYVPEELFGHVWLSNELHMAKPDVRIFEYVLSDAGYSADETLFVDDNERNCEVARFVGIHTFCPKVRTDWRSEFSDLLATLNK